ncbi:MAG: phosphotransferase [Legionella sp.]|nr:phosphotransferase [Legionella sp.]
MHERENALKDWLLTLTNNKKFKLYPLPGDASFRSYKRLEYEGVSQIVMDAPPDKETMEPFVTIANILRQAGIITPEIYAQNIPQGFLLLSDLGDTLLLEKLNAKTADFYYKEAINILLKLQNCPIQNIPTFDISFMLSEMNICSEWFFKQYLCLHLDEYEQHFISQTFQQLASNIAEQPQVFIHRDYHSRNLMLKDEASLGVIDFQDAMGGPFAYDLVSLLKDCYIGWPREKVLSLVRYFFTNSHYCKHYDLAEFIRAFDMCGLQRHIKILGVFSRLYLRDDKPGYLKHLPLTLKYVLECTKTYEELHAFHDFLKMRVQLP